MDLERSSVKRIVEEFVGATLGDRRRNQRTIQIVEKLAQAASQSLPAALGNDAAVQGCYRLMNNPDVAFEALHAPHAAATAKRAATAGRVLVVHDTTPCSFPNLPPEELGYLRTGKAGFDLHYSLVLAANAWKKPLGVMYAETIHRMGKPRPNRSAQAKKANRPGRETAKISDKEFARWWRGISSSHDALNGVEAIHIADRESDSYDLMSKAVAANIPFIFRVRVDRRGRQAFDPSDSWSTVKEVARRCEGVLEREVPLSARRNDGPPARSKTHPPRKMRMATLCFAATRVVIPRPQYLSAPLPRELEISLVHVYENAVPDGEPAVEWLLYTTEPIDTPERIAAIVDMYRSRWTIEEFNSALKTGCAYEAREFESRHALLNMLALSLPIACEIMWLRSRARSSPDAPATDVITPLQLDVLRQFSSYKLGRSPTVVDALLAVAALGGHLRRNGPPGWMVLLRGMTALQAYALGWQAALARGRPRRNAKL